MTSSLFLEIECAQCAKHGEASCGDAFLSHKFADEKRSISVLSDGLGSGVKACILANMTASMALKFIGSDSEILHSAEIIMDALPVCQVRKISYATFTIVDCRLEGGTRIIEMGNPAVIFVRDGKVLDIPHKELVSPRWQDRRMRVYTYRALPGDRIVTMSDGITQSGLGTEAWKLGWRRTGVTRFVEERLTRSPRISAKDLARAILSEARRKDPDFRPEDDMTCATFYYRKPRRLLLLSGPPYDKERDAEYAHMLDTFDGRKVVCGGTTANIVARELNRSISMVLGHGDRSVPAPSRMEGADLVTEGILTLTKVAQILEQGQRPATENAATDLVETFLDSDVIEFVVGTRVNQAHQDPSLPVDLEIRRNIIKRIAGALEETYLKETRIRYI